VELLLVIQELLLVVQELLLVVQELLQEQELVQFG
jgi:hypothetical protein